MLITNTDNSHRQPFMPEVFVPKPKRWALKYGLTEPRKERTLSLLLSFCTLLAPSLTPLLSFSLSQHAICGLWSQCPRACHLLDPAGFNKSAGGENPDPTHDFFSLWFILWSFSKVDFPSSLHFFYLETGFESSGPQTEKKKEIHSFIFNNHFTTLIQSLSWAHWVQGRNTR